MKRVGLTMTTDNSSESQIIRELEERIEALEIRLKHVSNDLQVTTEEYETAMNNYLEMYTNLERQTEELKRSKQILEQKSRELKTMLDSSPALIYYKYKNYRFMRVNQAFAETLGLPVEQILGKTYSELFPDYTDHGLEADMQVIQENRPIKGRKEYLETQHGTRQIVVDRIPYSDFNGEVVGIIGFAQDVTELKAAEEENRALEAELIQAQKMESIGVLAGGIAHDFNNMLGIILGYAQLAYEELEDGHPVKSDLSVVMRSTQRATGVARTLLDYARPQEFQFEPADLAEHISFVAKQLRKEPAFDKKRMSLEVEGEENLLSEVDIGKIEQCLFNLGKNAIQAVEDQNQGEIQITVRHVSLDKEFCKTRLGLTPGKYVRISISDNGVGIPEEHLQKIFDPFFTTKQIGEGTGLGLAQVYSIIQEHHGYIEVDSTVGQGSEFRIYLDLYAGEVNEEGSIRESCDCTARDGETVLVVDDTDQMREMVHRILTKYGYKTECVESGTEALRVYGTIEPDVVLMDHKMPGLSGEETIQKLKEQSPEANVILSSGYECTRSDLDRVGVNYYVSKPYRKERLAQTIRAALDSPEGVEESEGGLRRYPIER